MLYDKPSGSGNITTSYPFSIGITISNIWNSISSQPCPVSFSEEKRNRAMSESGEWNESEALLSRLRDDLGVDLEGGTGLDNIEWASKRNLEFRMEFLW